MDSDWCYREVPHTADLRLIVRGKSYREIFGHSAAGLHHLLRCKPASQAVQEEYLVNLQAHDLETLLVMWLNEIIYLCEERRICPSLFTIREVTGNTLSATVAGRRPWRTHRVIKAATFHDLAVVRMEPGYQVTLTFDV